MTGSARLYLDQHGYIQISKVTFRSARIYSESARLYLTWVGAWDTYVSKNIEIYHKPRRIYLGPYSGHVTTPPILLLPPIGFLEPTDEPARDSRSFTTLFKNIFEENKKIAFTNLEVKNFVKQGKWFTFESFCGSFVSLASRMRGTFVDRWS